MVRISNRKLRERKKAAIRTLKRLHGDNYNPIIHHPDSATKQTINDDEVDNYVASLELPAFFESKVQINANNLEFVSHSV